MERPYGVGGDVLIHLNMTPQGRRSRCLILHAADLDVFGAEASLDGGRTFKPLLTKMNPGDQQLYVQLYPHQGYFNASSVQLRLSFGYPLSDWVSI
jgi:hypothetical protein